MLPQPIEFCVLRERRIRLIQIIGQLHPRSLVKSKLNFHSKHVAIPEGIVSQSQMLLRVTPSHPTMVFLVSSEIAFGTSQTRFPRIKATCE